MIKLLVTDLDGTILFNDSFPKVVIEGIDKLLKGGINVAIASGRMLHSIVYYQRLLNLISPIIAYNGAMIGTLDFKILYHSPIPYPLWKEVALYLREEGLQINLYFNDSLYILGKTEYGENYPKQNKVDALFIEDLEGLPELPTTKLLGIGDADRIEKIIHPIKTKFDGAFYITTSSPTYLEIMKNGVSKGEAIKYLAKILDISISEIASVGDSFNDIELLKEAGVGITFKNAPEEVKEVANYITSKENTDGFKEVVEYILWRNHS
jgi:hypothetical protein